MIELFSLALWAHSTCSAPPSVSIPAALVALYRDESAVELVAYLCSEHPGGRWSGACSDAGACGPFQLVATWPRHFGYEPSDRDNPWLSADMAARLLTYSRERCSHSHNWRAHVKCSRPSRDRCGGPVGRWLRLRDDLAATLKEAGNGNS